MTGREGILRRAEIGLARIKDGRPAKGLFLVGLRGVGKTVLLNRVQDMAEGSGYAVIYIEVPENRKLPTLLVPAVRQLLFRLDRMEGLSERVKRGLRVLKSFVGSLRLRVDEIEFGLDIAPENGVADSGDLEIDVPELMVAVAEAARDRGTAVAIVMDEVQYLEEIELSAIIMAMHRIAQRGLPLTLVGAGLPQLVALAGRSKSYAERLFDFPELGPLAEHDARRALEDPVNREGVAFESSALASIVRVTEGYPYFLQEWGYHTWNAATTSPIGRAALRKGQAEAIRSLDASFFRVRFDRLTPLEKNYLRAMAELGSGPHRSGDIAERMERTVQALGPLRDRLIRKGMIYSPAHGETAFTVPLFDAFLKRTMPLFP